MHRLRDKAHLEHAHSIKRPLDQRLEATAQFSLFESLACAAAEFQGGTLIVDCLINASAKDEPVVSLGLHVRAPATPAIGNCNYRPYSPEGMAAALVLVTEFPVAPSKTGSCK